MEQSTTETPQSLAALDDAALVRLAQGGDDAAFGELTRRYTPLVFSIARARLDSADAAEELTQEVLLRVYLTLSSLRTPEAFPGWVRRVARNLALDWRKAGRRKSRLVTLVALDELAGETPDRSGLNARDTAAARQQNLLLDRALQGLPPALREVVVLRYLEGMSQPDAALRLGLHPTSVGRRLDRALAELRTVLEAPPDFSNRSAAGEASRLEAASGNGAPRSRSLTARCLALTAAAAALSESGRASAAAAASAGWPGWAVSLRAFQSKLASVYYTGGLLVTKTQALIGGTVLAAACAGGVFYSAQHTGSRSAGTTGAGMPPSGIAEFDALARAAAGSDFVVRARLSSMPAAKPFRWSGGDSKSGLTFAAAAQPFSLEYASILKMNVQQVTGSAVLDRDRYDIFVRTPPFDRIASAPSGEKDVRAMAARKLVEAMGWTAAAESWTVPQFRFVDPSRKSSPGGPNVIPPPSRKETLERLEAARWRNGRSAGVLWSGPVPLRVLLSSNYLVPSPAGSFRLSADRDVEERETSWWRRGQVFVPSGDNPRDLADFIAAFYEVGYVNETAPVDVHLISKP